MQGNLSKTLDVCDTARRALGSPAPQGVVPLEPEGGDPRPGCFAESSDLLEFQRLCSLGPMPKVELAGDELEALCAQLIAEPA